jgi:hypothetical protein
MTIRQIRAIKISVCNFKDLAHRPFWAMKLNRCSYNRMNEWMKKIQSILPQDLWIYLTCIWGDFCCLCLYTPRFVQNIFIKNIRNIHHTFVMLFYKLLVSAYRSTVKYVGNVLFSESENTIYKNNGKIISINWKHRDYMLMLK